MRKLTLNKIMILLDCRRGTYDISRHMGSARGEATDLIRAGLIRDSKDEGRYEVTAYGETLAKHIEAEAVFKVVLIAGSKHAD